MRKEKFYINSFFWMSFGAILSVKIVWLLAFWPGIATYDTLNQWNQAITGQYNNAHPFFYTFLLQISRYLTNSIWVVAVGQIVAFSFLGAWILYRGKKESLNNFLIYGGLIFYTFWPEFSIFSVTIWKDIFYSISALWISTLIYFSIKEGNFRKYQYPIIMASALPALFRHNGVIFLFLPYLLLIVFLGNERKRIFSFGAAAIFFYLIYSLVFLNLIGVKSARLVPEALRIKTVAAIYNQPKPNLNEQERAVFNRVIPEQDFKSNYDCAYVDNLNLNYFLKPRNLNYNSDHFDNPAFEKEWHIRVIAAALKNPLGVLRDHLCLGKFALGVGEYSNFYATENLETKELPEISQSSKLPHLKSFFIDLLEATSKSNLYFWIFWGTWVQSLLTLFICIYSIVRKNWAIFSFSVLILANVAMIILISPAADGRYLYLTSLASFSLVCFTLSLTSRMKGDKLN